MPFRRYGNPGPNVVADPFPSVVRLNAGKDVKARLEPGGKTMGDFKGLLQSVDRGKHAVDLFPLALHREIAMQFDHGLAGRNRIGSVYLDLVIILSKGCESKSK